MQRINLIPTPTKGRRLSAGQILALLLAALLVAALVTGWEFRTAQQNEARLAEADQRVEEAQEALDRFRRDNPDVADNSELVEEVERLQTLRTTRRQLLSNVEQSAGARNVSYYRFLESLANERVDGVWLTAFTLSSLEQSQRLNVAMTGQAEEADLLPQYLDRLRHSGLGGLSINDMRLNRLSESNAGGLYLFSLQTQARQADQATRQEARQP